MKECAIEIVAKRQRSEARPWMKGHEEQHKILQRAVTANKICWRREKARPKPWTETQNDDVERAVKQVQRARTIRRQVPKQWEEHLWNNFADEAEEAGCETATGRTTAAASATAAVGGAAGANRGAASAGGESSRWCAQASNRTS